jgi:hypothetical protein
VQDENRGVSSKRPDFFLSFPTVKAVLRVPYVTVRFFQKAVRFVVSWGHSIDSSGRSDVLPVYRFMTRDIATVAVQLGFILSVDIDITKSVRSPELIALLEHKTQNSDHGKRLQLAFLPIQ